MILKKTDEDRKMKCRVLIVLFMFCASLALAAQTEESAEGSSGENRDEAFIESLLSGSGAYGAGTLGGLYKEDAARSSVSRSADRPEASIIGGAEGYWHASKYGTIPAGIGLGIYASANLSYRGFSAVADLLAANDGKYGAALADIPYGNLYGFYLLMREGGVRYSRGWFSAEAGRLRFYDEVDTPYSVVINSRGIPATTMRVAYDDGTFFYNSRWIGLNLDSLSGITSAYSSYGLSSYPDRGATIKNTGFRIGNMRFGFQDATVYAGRWFDWEYFVSPMPMYMTQYCRGTGGVPWATGYDDNCNMGLFWDWQKDDSLYFEAQVLIDDFGLPFLGSSWNDNPLQMAAQTGARKKTSIGAFGAYAAMATKYTYEPSNSGSSTDAYGYTYYPETRFTTYWEGTGTTTAEIGIEDNEIGYKYGENNLALELNWTGSAMDLDLGAAFEFRLAGANSPANPGFGSGSIKSTGTEWLDDSVLEKRFMLTAAIAKRIGPWRLYGSLSGGVALDSMTLVEPSAGSGMASIYYYEPIEGNTVGIFCLDIGASYRFNAYGKR